MCLGGSHYAPGYRKISPLTLKMIIHDKSQQTIRSMVAVYNSEIDESRLLNDLIWKGHPTQ